MGSLRYEKTKGLAQFLNDKISYASRHKKGELETLYDLVDFIGNEMEFPVDRRDWFSLCNTVPPENRDDNAIS